MPKKKLPKLGPEQPPKTRILGDKYPKGESGISVIRDGVEISIDKLPKKKSDA